jgi:hypothetical protein
MQESHPRIERPPSGATFVKKSASAAGARKSSGDKYFRKKTALHARSVPAILDQLDTAWMIVRRNTDLLLPEQNIQSKEVFVATLCVWIHDLIAQGGVRAYEKIMREPFEKMAALVEQDLKTRPCDADQGGPRPQVGQASSSADQPQKSASGPRRKPRSFE